MNKVLAPGLTPDQTNAHAAPLWKVSEATGQMNLTQVADSSAFAIELLVPDDCFVLGNGLRGKTHTWKGRKANEKEQQAALRWPRTSPRNAQMEILHRESLICKRFFKNFK